MKKPTIQEIQNLSDKIVAVTFSDGCSMQVRIVETMHLDEGNDFAANILKVNCTNQKHWHPSPGTCINIRREDVDSIEEIGRNQPTIA